MIPGDQGGATIDLTHPLERVSNQELPGKNGVIPVEEKELGGYFDSPEDGPPTWLLMLRAYLDESGHESKGWMFLAGWLGNSEQWTKFATEWKKGLGPQRKFLHMTDLRWNQERTRKLLARLGPIPESCGLKGLLGGVRFEDYEDLVTGTPEAKLMKGYMACLFPLVEQTLKGIPKEERIELVFEHQREYEPFVDMVLPTFTVPNRHAPWHMMLNGKPKLAKWGFVPKGSTILADPADYLAFALREAWTDKTSKKAQWCSPILKAGDGTGFGAIMKRKQIRYIVTSTSMARTFASFDERLAELYFDEVAKRGLPK